MIVAMLLNLLAVVAGLGLLVRSGAFSPGMRKQAETIAKRIIRDGKLALLPGEQAERMALAQHRRSAQELVLLIFTTKKLLLYFLSWGKISRIEQFPFESIKQVQPPSVGSLDLARCLKVTMTVDGDQRDLTYYHVGKDFLRLLGEEFSRRTGKASGVRHAVLCLSCLQPLQGDRCPACASTLTPDWKPVWLSLLVPGLGQLRNGEMQKGLVFIIATTIFLLVEYIGIKGWLFEGADLTLRDKTALVSFLGVGLSLYIGNVIDAYRSSIRGRKRE